MPKFVRRRLNPVYEFRRKFDAKLGPTQLYENEKALVVLAVKDHEYESISAFCREAVREKLERLGYPIPAEDSFSMTESVGETDNAAKQPEPAPNN